MRKFFVVALVMATFALLSAAPASAINHPFIPADECGQSDNAGGETAFLTVTGAPGQPFVKRAENTEGPQAGNTPAPSNCN